MKIIQPIGTISGAAISRIAITLAEEFATEGHESTLVVWNRDKLDIEIDSRVKIVRTNIIGLSRRNNWTRLLRGIFKPFLGPRLFLVLFAPFISKQLQKKVIDEGDYDVAILHAHSVFNFRFIKLPYLVVAHNTKSRQLLKAKTVWQNKMLFSIYKKIYMGKTIATVSDGIRMDFINKFGLPPDLITRIYNPFYIDNIQEKSLAEVDDCPPENSYIISVGRNDVQKRFDRLVRVYKKSSISEDLVILGRAGENQELREQVDELGLKSKVKFIGFRDNPFPYIKNAKFLVVSSDYEGLASTIIEALICGTPVTSTDCPSGPREILLGEFSKWLVEPEDEEGFSHLFNELSKHPYAVPQFLYQGFRARPVARQYLDLLNKKLQSCN